MNIELSYLRQIFESIMDNSIVTVIEDDGELDILNEVNRLKQRIHSFTPDKNLTSEEFISIQLSSISRLIKELEDALNQKELSQENRKLLLTMLTSLERMLNYLWRYFPGEFDLSIPLSKLAIDEYRKDYQKKIEDSIKYILNLEVSQDLQDILIEALQLRLSGTPTYNSISFSLGLIGYLESNIPNPITEKEIAITLISRQFNHPRFYEFCRSAITEKLNKMSVISDHYRELIFMRKTLIQIPIQKKPAYSSSSETIFHSLQKLLDSELAFLKELDFMNTELVNSGLLDSNYKVSLSVKQLAFYIYLNVEVGIITEQKATRVHQYIISHVSTAEKDDISEKSFSNGYYVHSPEDIRKVSEKLARMLAIAQEKY